MATAERIKQVLLQIETFRDAASKSLALAITQEPLAKALRGLLYKIAPLEESLLTLVVEDSSPSLIKPKKPPPPRPSDLPPRPSEVPTVHNNATLPQQATPKLQPKKLPPPSLKKAPPPQLKKCPPNAKKPPPVLGSTQPTTAPHLPRLDLDELNKQDADLLPEVLPDNKLIPKPIQWQGLPREKTAGSIWEHLLERDKQLMSARDYRAPLQSHTNASAEIGGESVPRVRLEVAFDSLDKLFFENIEERKKLEEQRASLAEAAAAAAKKRVYSILDEKRTQNIEISLKGLGLKDDFSPILNAINKLQFGETDSATDNTEAADLPRSKRTLKAEDLSLLLGLYPKEEDEIRKLKKLAADPPPDQRIATADRFLLCLLDIKRFKPRVETILGQLTFRADIGTTMDKSARLLKVCNMALSCIDNGALQAVLALILKIGNYVNCHSKKPVVAGLQLSALESLKSIKSLDGSKTFLRLIGEHIDEQYPEGWQHLEWLEQCSEATDSSIDDLVAVAKGLQSKLDKIRSEVEYAKTNDDQLFIDTFEPAYIESVKRLAELSDRLTEISQKLMDLAAKFADKAKTPREAQDILRKLSTFGKDLMKVKREIQAEKLAKERKKQRATLRERTPLAHSRQLPPAAQTARASVPVGQDLLRRRKKEALAAEEAKLAESKKSGHLDTVLSLTEESKHASTNLPTTTNLPSSSSATAFSKGSTHIPSSSSAVTSASSSSKLTESSHGGTDYGAGGTTTMIPLRHYRYSAEPTVPPGVRDSPPIPVLSLKRTVAPSSELITKAYYQRSLAAGQGRLSPTSTSGRLTTIRSPPPTSSYRSSRLKSPHSERRRKTPSRSNRAANNASESDHRDELLTKHKKTRSHVLHRTTIGPIQSSLMPTYPEHTSSAAQRSHSSSKGLHYYESLRMMDQVRDIRPQSSAENHSDDSLSHIGGYSLRPGGESLTARMYRPPLDDQTTFLQYGPETNASRPLSRSRPTAFPTGSLLRMDEGNEDLLYPFLSTAAAASPLPPQLHPQQLANSSIHHHRYLSNRHQAAWHLYPSWAACRPP